MKINKMTKAQLVAECDRLGLATDGLKAALLQRLKDNMEPPPENEPSEAGSGISGEEGDSENESIAGSAASENLKVKLALAKTELKLLREKAKLGLFNSTASASAAGSKDGNWKARLPVQQDTEEIGHFFLSYERSGSLQGVDERDLARQLPEKLNAANRLIYNNLPMSVCLDYVVVKAEMLKASRKNAKYYLDRFRSIRRTGTASYTQFLQNLKETQNFYFEVGNIASFDELKSAMLIEQFLSTLPDQVKLFVSSREAKTADEAARLADLSFECGRGVVSGSKGGAHAKPHDNAASSRGYIGGKPRFQYPDGNKGGVEAKPEVQPTTQKGGGSVRPTQEHTSGPSGPRVQSSQTGSSFEKTADNCWKCGSTAHKRRFCPMKDARATVGSISSNVVTTFDFNKVSEYQNSKFIFPLYVNGQCISAFRDTACMQTLINADLLPVDHETGSEFMSVQGVFGDSQNVRLTKVKISAPCFGQGDRQFDHLVGLVKGLKQQLLLGNDFFATHTSARDICTSSVITESDTKNSFVCESENNCLEIQSTDNRTLDGGDQGRFSEIPFAMITTRRNNYQFKTPPIEKTSESFIQNRTPNVLVEKQNAQLEIDTNLKSKTDTVIQLNGEFEVDDRTMIADVNDTRSRELIELTRTPDTTHACYESDSEESVRRMNNNINLNDDRNNKQVKNGNCGSGPELDQRVEEVINKTGLIINKDAFRLAQENDKSLDFAREMAARGHANYFMHKGLLYRKSEVAGWDDDITGNVLVVPESCRGLVLALGHDHVTAAHYGINKTKARIQRLFHWHKMGTSIANYVKSCKECQLTSSLRKADRAPLVAVPIVDKLFESWTMDIIGPVQSKGGKKKYCLILTEGCTHWVEAYPLSSMRADQVCKKLIELFSRFGVCKRLYSDQGSSFMSEITRGLQNLLGCEAIAHSAYAHHTSGLVERYVGTLKRQLRKFIESEPARWEELLPFLLFSYREIEHSTTGFAPSELLFGTKIRGPLAVLKDAWSADDLPYPSKQNVVNYLLETRKRLELCRDFAVENAEKSRDKAKLWYDKVSTDRKLDVGQKVLILLPSSENRLLCKWTGPGIILKRRNDVSYEVQIGRRISTLHINLLRPFIERNAIPNMTAQANVTLVVDSCEAPYETLPGIDDCDEDGKQPEISLNLSTRQRAELSQMFQEYSDVFTSKLGLTNLLEHNIVVTDQHPCVSKSYRIPDSLRDQVDEQIKIMLENGTVRPSFSNYRAPLICVRKPGNKGIRIVADLRLLNQKTISDEYGAPSPRQILDSCVGAKFISIIDLTNAFFQVPLREECRHLTAFEVNRKLFEFCVAPQGAKNSSKTFQRLMDIVLSRIFEILFRFDIGLKFPGTSLSNPGFFRRGVTDAILKRLGN